MIESKSPADASGTGAPAGAVVACEGAPLAPNAAALPIVIKRDGRRVAFDARRIHYALERAFRATLAWPSDAPLPSELLCELEALTEAVVRWCHGRTEVAVEEIQDEVERALMRSGRHAVARRYILYREARAEARRREQLVYRCPDGTEKPFPHEEVQKRIEAACEGLSDVDPHRVYHEFLRTVYSGISEAELDRALLLATRSFIEQEPNYTYVAARLLLDTLYREVWGRAIPVSEQGRICRSGFRHYVEQGMRLHLLDARMKRFDLERLAASLQPERDRLFTLLGLQTLSDRYLLRDPNGRRLEVPQYLWMRVAMGLALDEPEPTAAAESFYELLSTFRFMNSTPTLFNAGTLHPQLSSCYVSTVQDDLGAIFKAIRDNALLSKWAGGLGNDWTPIRALGAHIRGTNGRSQGVIPFLKIVNDTAVAVNQGGKRKGAVCAYLEVWHLDIEEFLELRRNTGDERRRTHDMNTACWIPDLFLHRVRENEPWTLFSPDEVPDLHELYGRAFRARYEHYEREAEAGQIRNWRRVSAKELWRKMLSLLFETGHPWLTFKDPCNIRSPQDHVGVIHSSNLCTEITLPTSAEEIAVCNLGSINLPAHLDAHGRLNTTLLRETVRIAVRMLDNVIDLNFYPVPEARTSNLRHRPIGLGLMGFQDALYQRGVSYASQAAVDFADEVMELIAYFAYEASADLAAERGPYPSWKGSKWDRGLLPLDTLDLLEAERGEPIPVPRTARLDWNALREKIRRQGMRNSNVLALAPTATIANICGVSPSIEPTYRNLYVKSNLSGEFTQVNPYLVRALKTLGLWDAAMLEDLKYYDGSVQDIQRIPPQLRELYRTAFEIAPQWLIECAARRQKWIDQSQSLNLYMAEPSGRKLSEMYFLAWQLGLKTTYYLRTLAATQIEKSTLDINRRGLQPRWMKSRSPSSDLEVRRHGPACTTDKDLCETCQ
ncbi:MAG: ribonucleoside-diphosphate reductase subunit alpha [Verrucomicrobiota bacterium]|nr:ribonucleoside-diphosphate reductase subunit alpha [Limisphaera sp.]MDW8382958.1 ribonucleoside-diphosphate reductase subunit alpha [Verrucomicrobiota bacterium]